MTALQKFIFEFGLKTAERAIEQCELIAMATGDRDEAQKYLAWALAIQKENHNHY